MKLTDILVYLKDEKTFQKFLAECYPDIDYYDIEFYSEKSFDIESEIIAFDINITNYQREYVVNGKKYIFMISTEDLLNIYDDVKDLYEDEGQIAERIMQYVINDA